MAERHVVLIGLPRAARTSSARLLAKVLERPFAEVDEVLELAGGCSLPRLRRQRGEAEVRRLEGRLLAEMLGRCTPLVISAPEPTEVGDELRSVVADSAVVFWIRDRVGLPDGGSALCQELAYRVVEVEVRDTEDRPQGSFTTFVVAVSTDANGLPVPLPDALGVAWVWPLAAGPSTSNPNENHRLEFLRLGDDAPQRG